MAAPSMNALAEEYADQKIGSVFLYTHEAHPGENYLHLTSIDQKFRHAEALRDVLNVSRPILVDALDGACHRAYGSMPNMTWIFSRNGVVQYKSNWTATDSVARALEHLLDVKQRRRQRENLTPFIVEKLDYRLSDREGFIRGLERSGPKAVEEYTKAF
jgi:hypothetical protein